VRFNVFLSGFGSFVYIAGWRYTQIPTFFFGPAHSVKGIQCPAIILNFWCSQIKSQHHLIFRYGKI